MAVAGVLTVTHLATHPFHLVVSRVAVGKAVGHEHIQHIGIRESLFALVVTSFELKRHGLILLLELKVEVHGTGFHPVHTHADD